MITEITEDDDYDMQVPKENNQNDSIKIITSLNPPLKTTKKESKKALPVYSKPKLRENYKSKKFINDQNKKIQEFKFSSNKKVLKDTINNNLLNDHKKKNVNNFKATDIKYKKYKNIEVKQISKNKKKDKTHDSKATSQIKQQEINNDFNKFNFNINLDDTISLINDNSIDLIATYLNTKGIKIKNQTKLKKIENRSSNHSISNKNLSKNNLTNQPTNENNNYEINKNNNNPVNTPFIDNLIHSPYYNTKRQKPLKLSSLSSLNSSTNKSSNDNTKTHSNSTKKNKGSNNIKKSKNSEIKFNQLKIGDVFFSISDKSYKLDNSIDKNEKRLQVNDKIKNCVRNNMYLQNPYSIKTPKKINSMTNTSKNFRVYEKKPQKNLRLYKFCRKDGKILIKSLGELGHQTILSSATKVNKRDKKKSRKKKLHRKKSLLHNKFSESLESFNHHKKIKKIKKKKGKSNKKISKLLNSDSFSSFNNIIINYNDKNSSTSHSKNDVISTPSTSSTSNNRNNNENHEKEFSFEKTSFNDNDIPSLSLQKYKKKQNYIQNKINEYQQTMKKIREKSRITVKNDENEIANKNITNLMNDNTLISTMSKEFNNKVINIDNALLLNNYGNNDEQFSFLVDTKIENKKVKTIKCQLFVYIR